MKIRSFKLVNRGLKGSIVEYDDSKSINDLTFVNGFKERHKAPVPGNLKDVLSKLRVHLLKISGYWLERYDGLYDFDLGMMLRGGDNPGQDYFVVRDLLDRMTIEEVKYDGSNFIIIGMMSTMLGGKKVKIKSPMLGIADEYEMYSGVVSILEDSFKMIKRYIAGDIIQNSNQFVLDFYQEKGMSMDESEEMLAEMSEEDKKSFMKEALEKMGLIVLESVDEVLEGISDEEVIPSGDLDNIEKEEEQEDKEDEEEEEFAALDKRRIVKMKVA
jgi:hypothetical protein